MTRPKLDPPFLDPPFLDDEEKDLITSAETALANQAPTPLTQDQRQFWQDALNATTRKRPVTVRLQETDLRRLRVIAQRKGIPYQTLIGSILHQYATGELREADLNTD